jgi:hypothetical protein
LLRHGSVSFLSSVVEHRLQKPETTIGHEGQPMQRIFYFLFGIGMQSEKGNVWCR